MIANKALPAAVAILGRGRLGTALSTALQQVGVTVEHLPGRELALPGAPIALLAVPDDAVAATASRLAKRLGEPHGLRVALHLSGVLGSSVLHDLAARGVATGSCHPLQTFPTGAGLERFRDVTFALEGEESARRAARALAERLGGHVLEIDAAKKPLWHLAASLAANGAVGLVGAALEALRAVGLDDEAARRALAPLVTTAVAEAFARGPVEALTGAVARGDRETLSRHRAVLTDWDATRLALFEALVREQERLTATRNRRGPAV